VPWRMIYAVLVGGKLATLHQTKRGARDAAARLREFGRKAVTFAAFKLHP
jgi:hypothetical protein